MVADLAKLAVGREEYYEEYLSGHGESPGRWYGAGARALDLHGEASVAGFQRMLHTHLVAANRTQGRTAAGRPWMAATCTGIGWPPTPSTGRPTSGS